ncbi:MAG TPA: MopE-related protein [Candidatus Polarisedimenticolia bacterium]|nr:MopE-related protein [Candidatus Polarisedimenticolia bacterium]
MVSTGGFNSGSALIVSLSGADPSVGYLVESAHSFDPATGLLAPLSCGLTVQPLGTAGGHLILRFTHPPIHTDCDPESIGVLALSTCQDAFLPTLSYGQVYTLTQRCSSRVDVRREFWTGTGIVPAADGTATITVEQPGFGYCTLIGSTTVVNGVETGIITGLFLTNNDCIDDDGDSYTTCGGDCDDHNAAVHPGATEICNGIDDNCDRQVDEGFDVDADTIADCFDNCPNVANITQADRDGDSVGDVCDNCLDVPNPDQRDLDNDGFGDFCDNCPTIPNPDQNGCVCDNCEMPSASISFSSPLGKGSGLVTWNSPREVDVLGYNVVEYTNKGERIQLNPVMIRCEECVTGLGHIYTYIIPKHKSGKNIFIEMLRINGNVQVFGPATRI